MPNDTRQASPFAPDALPKTGPYSFNEVLVDELKHLRPASVNDLRASGYENPENPDVDAVSRAENLRRLYGWIGKLPESNRLSAICLSGGGIRSATFNLGVLQGLAGAGVLDRFDYMSTVSGGGYIGGWLKAWIYRRGTPVVMNELTLGSGDTPMQDGVEGIPENPLQPEPKPIDRLREYSNYLTPHAGLLSADSWAAAAIVVRNLLLNWLVVVPVLMAALAIPQIYERLLHVRPIGPDLGPLGATWAIGVAIASGLVTSFAIHSFRRPGNDPGAVTRLVLWFGLAPMLVSTAALALGAAWLPSKEIPAFGFFIFAALWCILIPLLGWAWSEPFWRLDEELRWPWRELLALILSGVVGAILLTWIAVDVYPMLRNRPVLYTIVAVPVLLSIYLFARTIFVALSDRFTRGVRTAGIAGREDADKEWWARYSGYILMSALLWLVVSGLSLAGWKLAIAAFRGYALPMLTSLGGLSAISAVVIGMSGVTGSGRGNEKQSKSGKWQNIFLAVAAPAFIIVLFVLLARAYHLIGLRTAGSNAMKSFTGLLSVDAGTTTLAAVGNYALPALVFLVVALLMAKVVNVNRFSLHGLYRNRLVRAYLGASNPGRAPDPFTGFDPEDNVLMQSLWREPAHASDIDCRRPLLVINATLNLVRGARLAWQERKAESFSISPFYCGNFYEGYRSSKQYAGRRGITLGTAMTISGAAANPNMGYHSSAGITFLLGLFNARLGAWLGNTNVRGNDTYRRTGPTEAIWPIFAELFGLTDSRTKYVQLSDGGHFDNLGLYEMVLRRCRFILVSDAGQDPEYGFEDLGNAIRKIRIDFGISIEFKAPIEFVSDEKIPGVYFAVGQIRYPDVDGTGVTMGTVLYMKPTVKATVKPERDILPYDVFSYHRKSDQFPHETTNDQWFSESQFESYRALGKHSIAQVLNDLDVLPTLLEMEKKARSVANLGSP